MASISTDCFSQEKYRKDFDYYWLTVNEHFAYFDTQTSDWRKVKDIYGPIADTISTRASFIRLLERVNNELYNGHISLNTNLPSSGRLIPTGSDFWVAYQQGDFVITGIRDDFGAQRCGLRVGMKILRYNGESIRAAIVPLLPRSVVIHNVRMLDYAANVLLAGTPSTRRAITVLAGAVEKTFYPDVDQPLQQQRADRPLLDIRVPALGIGYIAINNSLGNMDLVAAFDSALDSLKDTEALILDLRETPSGGNTTLARAIMGRFIKRELPYQKHSLPNEETVYRVKRSWLELVAPRGRTYDKPLIVLVNRWTGSMGEGLAIGFHGMKRATVVGDRMAGLLGAVYSFTMPQTGIGFTIPAEKLYHVTGLPREQFVPDFLEPDNEKCLARALELTAAGARKAHQ